jgi:hypothetical protein
MGIRYQDAKGIQWGQKRFSTVAELLTAVTTWTAQNEDVLAELHMRCDYEYFSQDKPIEETNPAQ